jgi:hypothetical protein
MQHGQDAFSPPTPKSTTEEDLAIRSSISEQSKAASCSPRTRVDSPRAKPTPKARKSKTKAAKSDKARMPKLTAPLSVLTRDQHHVPVKNMEAWVNRPAEARRKEAEKRDGYITRPMNSFMLYRSAYADRAKAWCLQNNHQVVSSVAGESWPLEPPEVREQYNNYAKIERINHHNAHPTYKFSPSKATAPMARKRKTDVSDDEEPSDLEDEWGSHARHTRKFDRSISYTSNVDYFEQAYGNKYGMNRSSWNMTNEGRPMPVPMHGDLYNQYYQTTTYTMHPASSFTEDVDVRAVGAPAPAMQFSSSQALLGLPGGSDLMQQLHSHAGSRYENGQVDPMLLAYHGGQLDIPYRGSQSSMSGEQPHGMERAMELRPTHDDYNPSWQSDPTMSSLNPESEFDKWVGDH